MLRKNWLVIAVAVAALITKLLLLAQMPEREHQDNNLHKLMLQDRRS